MRRFDLGVASYGNVVKLERALRSIQSRGKTDWRCFIVHNPGASDDQQVRQVIDRICAQDARFIAIWNEKNLGYAGAVNKIFEAAETEYIGYCDNDVEIMTDGWDEQFCSMLDRFHEIGMIFPNFGAYSIIRPAYTEIMWGVGFCWVISRLAMRDTGIFDQSLGHQEEADYALRLRMAGYKCAALSSVNVIHHASATNDTSQTERISRGVVNWVNKWNRYFNGINFNYHSPNVTRWEDWPPNALYLEDYWRVKLPGLNDNPEVRKMDGRDYDLLKVPRLSGFYRGRII